MAFNFTNSKTEVEQHSGFFLGKILLTPFRILNENIYSVWQNKHHAQWMRILAKLNL